MREQNAYQRVERKFNSRHAPNSFKRPPWRNRRKSQGRGDEDKKVAFRQEKVRAKKKLRSDIVVSGVRITTRFHYMNRRALSKGRNADIVKLILRIFVVSKAHEAVLSQQLCMCVCQLRNSHEKKFVDKGTCAESKTMSKRERVNQRNRKIQRKIQRDLKKIQRGDAMVRIDFSFRFLCFFASTLDTEWIKFCGQLGL